MKCLFLVWACKKTILKVVFILDNFRKSSRNKRREAEPDLLKTERKVIRTLKHFLPSAKKYSYIPLYTVRSLLCTESMNILNHSGETRKGVFQQQQQQILMIVFILSFGVLRRKWFCFKNIEIFKNIFFNPDQLFVFIAF